MRSIIKFLLGLIKGAAVESGPLSIFKDLKKLNTRQAMKFLDANGDGKFTMADVKELQWETIGKFLGVIAAWLLLYWLTAKYNIPL